MKRNFLFFLIVASVFTIPAYGADNHLSQSSFHASQTEAEKRLDEIFQSYNKSPKLDEYIFDLPGHTQKSQKKFSPFFTKDFLSKARKKHKELVASSCGGKTPKNGLPCDALEGTNPIFCASDNPDKFFFSSTLKTSGTVLVNYASSSGRQNEESLFI